MYTIVFLAGVCATALGALGAFVVRGKRLPAVFVAGLPALPAIAGALFFSRGMQIALGAVAGEAVAPDFVMRILAQGTAEANACLVLGFFVAACSCGAASAALLGSAATLAPPRGSTAGNKSFIAPLALGVIGVVAAVVLRFGTRSLPGTMVVAVPSLILVTLLATVVATRAPMVRGWHDKREANAWLAAVAAASLLSASGLVLADLSALYATERVGLSTTAGEVLDLSQRAVILAQTASEVRAAKVFAAVDGSFAFAIVASALFPAFGRGPDGSSRSPLAAPFFVAIGVVVFSTLAIGGLRSSAMSSVTGRAEWTATLAPKIDLPVVLDASRFEKGEDNGPVIRIEDDGKLPAPPLFASYQRNIVVEADRHVRWAAVELAIHLTMMKRINESSEGGARAPAKPPIPTLSIRFAPEKKPDLTPLGPYAMFFAGAPPPSLLVSLEGAPETVSGTTKRVTLEQMDDIQTVVEKLAAARAGAASYGGPRLVVPSVQRPSW